MMRRGTTGRRRAALLGGMCAATLLLGAGTATAAPLSPEDSAIVDATVQQAMQEARLPGVTVKLDGPKGSYEKTYGVSDTATSKPMALDDHVRIASITKTFTATAVLREVDRGHIALSDKLEQYVPGIPNGRRITIRQLLTMRSGLYDFTSDPAFNRKFNANPLLRFGPADAVAITRRHKPIFAPGARTQYTDSNYVLLGLILEKVTGDPVAAVINRDVVKVAGLRETSFPTTAAMPAPFSHGYFAGVKGDGPLRDYTEVNPRVAWTAGAMISTIGDLEKWGELLANGSLLSRATQAERLKFGTIPNPGGPAVGYGMGIMRVADWVGHDGAILGFSTITMVERNTGARFAAAANLSSNFSTPTLDVFFKTMQALYPETLKAG